MFFYFEYHTREFLEILIYAIIYLLYNYKKMGKNKILMQF